MGSAHTPKWSKIPSSQVPCTFEPHHICPSHFAASMIYVHALNNVKGSRSHPKLYAARAERAEFKFSTYRHIAQASATRCLLRKLLTTDESAYNLEHRVTYQQH